MLIAGIRTLLVAGLACAMTCAHAQESASYTMRRITVTPLAGRSVSASFVNVATVSDVIGSAGVCPSGAAAAAGFWSLAGAGAIHVPTVLRVGKAGGDALLNWTGQAPAFDVYRSESPTGVVAPPNLLSTASMCSMADGSAPSPIFYYLVVPSALERGGS